MGLWKSFKNLGLGLKLSIALTIGMGILLAAVAVVVFVSAQNLTAQAGRGRAGQEAEVIQSRFAESRQDVLDSAEYLLRRIPLEEALLTGESPADIRTMMVNALFGLDLDSTSVVDANGAYVAVVEMDVARVRTGGEGIISPQRDDLLASSLSDPGSTVTSVILEADGSAFWLAAAIPLRGPSREIIGAVLAARRVDDELLQELNFSRKDVHLALVADGQIMAHDIPSPEILSELSDALVQEPYAGAGDNRETIVADDLLRSADGTPYVLTHFPFAEADASTAILVDMSELYVSRRQLLVTTTVVLGSLALVAVLGVTLFTRTSITIPLRQLRAGVERIVSGDYRLLVETESMDEVGQLTKSFNDMAVQLRQLLTSLEQRGADLQRLSVQLQASTEVARGVASILAVDRLIRQVVDLIRERFDLYYVGLFLLDEEGEWAVLQAGVGEAGRAMVERGHRIKVGEGMVGWSIAHAQARVAEEVGEDAVRLATEELPDTRSEAALVLRSRGQVLGALTVQSDQMGAFDEQTVAVLQTMADQVAVAIDNARLYDKSQAALAAERRAYGAQGRAAWAEHLRVRPNVGYYCDGSVVTPISERAQVPDDEESPAFSVPVVSRGQVIGTISARRPDGVQAWTEAESQLLETLADQLGQTLESARLYQDSLRRAAREQLVGEVTARVRETLDVETVLRVAAQEVRQSLGLPEVVIRLAPDQDGS